ncbi:MAG: GYF domain-containing protein [Pseudomonas sp.]
MTATWYYAGGDRQRQGPLAAEQIVALYRAGRIGLDTLVWREGLAQWQPLAGQADTLGILAPPHAPSSLPPPLPPAPVAPPLPAADTASPGLSGGALAIIISGVAGMFLLTLASLIAAIALPVYQEYLLRSQTAAALARLQTHTVAVAEFQRRQGRCPVNGEGSFGTPEHYADGPLGTLRIGRFDNGHCGLEGQLAVPGKPEIDGKAIWLDYDEAAGSWHCSSEIDDRYLPNRCRG